MHRVNIQLLCQYTGHYWQDLQFEVLSQGLKCKLSTSWKKSSPTKKRRIMTSTQSIFQNCACGYPLGNWLAICGMLHQFVCPESCSLGQHHGHRTANPLCTETYVFIVMKLVDRVWLYTVSIVLGTATCCYYQISNLRKNLLFGSYFCSFTSQPSIFALLFLRNLVYLLLIIPHPQYDEVASTPDCAVSPLCDCWQEQYCLTGWPKLMEIFYIFTSWYIMCANHLVVFDS